MMKPTLSRNFAMLTLTIGFGLPVASFAQSDGTHNGKTITEKKETVTQKDGKLVVKTHDDTVLADLAEHVYGRCIPKKTSSLLREYNLEGRMNSIFKTLKLTHGLMAYKVRRMMDSINWCLTDHLKTYATPDEDAISVNYLPEKQVAIRDMRPDRPDPNVEIVYVDTTELKKLDTDNQVMSLIHEVMHSFISDRARRTSNIRTFVNVIYDNYKKWGKYTSDKLAWADHLGDFDAMLNMTNMKSFFGSTKVGQNFNRLVSQFGDFSPKATAEASSSIRYIVENAADSSSIFQILVNELGHPGVLWYNVYSYELLHQSDEVKYHLPNGYRFGEMYSMIEKLVKKDAPPDFNTAGSMTMNRFGACRIGFNGTFRAEWTRWPDYYTDEHTYILQVWKGDKMVYEISREPGKEKERRKYIENMNDLLLKLRNGLCDNTNASGLAYVK